MEIAAQPPKSPFSDLFKPAEPIGATPVTAPETSPNAATAPANPVSPGSAASANGTVTADQALSGLDHTKVASVSASGAPGAAGPAPLAPAASVSLGGIVQGEWATNIMDAVLPAVIVFALHYFGIKLRKSEVQLTEKEKSTVAPIMQKCLDSILLNFNNPWSALAWTLGAIYGGKLIEKGGIQWLESKEQKQEDEALKAKIEQAERATDPAKYDYANASANDIQTGQVATPMQPYTEQEVRNRMKKAKVSREKAIEYLERQHAKKQAA